MKHSFTFLLLFYVLSSGQAQNNNAPEPLPCRFIYPVDADAVPTQPLKYLMSSWKFDSFRPFEKNEQSFCKYALIETCPQNDTAPADAPIIGVLWHGERIYRPLIKVLDVFEMEEDALEYAEYSEKVPMAWFKEDEERVDYISGIWSWDYRTDWVIQYIKDQLPPDWEMVQSESERRKFPITFTIQAKYTALVTHDNLINAPESAFEEHLDSVFMKKHGQEIRPFFRFELHRQWSEEDIQKANLNERNWKEYLVSKNVFELRGYPMYSDVLNVGDYYLANAHQFGLKVSEKEGFDCEMEQVLLPKDVKSKPWEVFQMVKDILTPKVFSGLAENIELGCGLLADDGSFYFYEYYGRFNFERQFDRFNPNVICSMAGPRHAWRQETLGKRLALRGLLLQFPPEEPLNNMEGKDLVGASGKVNVLINSRSVDPPEKKD